MSKPLIRVGIGSWDINGITSKKILQIAEKLQLFEFCTLIIYGYSSVLSYHRKILKLPFVRINLISSAKNAKKNTINLVDISNQTIPSSLEKTTEESIVAAERSFNRGLSDLKTEEIDVFVWPAAIDSLPLIDLQSLVEKGLPIWINDLFRFAKIPDSNSAETLTKAIKMLHSTLRLDFMISLPRIAVLLMHSSSETTEFVIKNNFQEGIFCFGPFLPEKFFHSKIYKTFDATLVVTNEPIDFIFRFLNNETNLLFISNSSYIITLVNQQNALQQAIYLAMDIYRNRKTNQEGAIKQFFEKPNPRNNEVYC